MFLISLSSSRQVPNVPARDHFSRVDNMGKTVLAAISRVDCTMIKVKYYWSKCIATWDLPDDLNPKPLTLFPLSRN